MTPEEKHARRITLRKQLVLGSMSDAELQEFMILDDELVAITKPGTIGRGRVAEFISGVVA